MIFPGSAGRKPRRFSAGFLRGERGCLRDVRGVGRGKGIGVEVGGRCLVVVGKGGGRGYCGVAEGVFLGYVEGAEGRCKVKVDGEDIVVMDLCVMDCRDGDDEGDVNGWNFGNDVEGGEERALVDERVDDCEMLTPGMLRLLDYEKSPQAVQVSPIVNGGEKVRFDVDVRLLAECMALMDRKQETIDKLKAVNDLAESQKGLAVITEDVSLEVERLVQLLAELNRRLDLTVPGLRAAGAVKKGVDIVLLSEEKERKKRGEGKPDLCGSTNDVGARSGQWEQPSKNVSGNSDASTVLSKALVRSAFERLEEGSRLRGASLTLRGDVMECVGKCVALLLKARLTRNPQQVLDALSDIHPTSESNIDVIEQMRNSVRGIANSNGDVAGKYNGIIGAREEVPQKHKWK